MNNYTTVTDTLNTLREEGYVLDFNLKTDCVECKSHNKNFLPMISLLINFIGLKERVIRMTMQ